MTLIVTVDVECDHPDCLEWTHGEVGRTTVARLSAPARRRAASDGWVHRKGMDYCPAHADPNLG